MAKDWRDAGQTKNRGGMRIALLTALAAALAFVMAGIYAGDVWQGPEGPVVHLKDDNMITLRVARVMAETGAPYFNHGEAVAASTSLFWPVVLAPVAGLTGENLTHWLFHASALACALAALAAAGLVRGRVIQIGLVAAILLNPGLRAYGGSGWEHIPQMLAVTLGFGALLMNGRRRFSTDALGFMAVCLGFVFRPDIAVLAVGAWLLFAAAQLRARPGPMVAVSLLGLAVPVGYAALMLHYYGDLVPNTYHLKGGGPAEIIRGLAYIATPRLAGWVPFVVLATAALLWRSAAEAAPRDRIVAVILLAHVALTALTGGDVFSAGRFYLVILPIGFALAVRAGATLGKRGALVATALLLLPVFWPRLPGWQGPLLARDTFVVADKHTSHLELTALIEDRLTPGDGAIGLHRLGQAYHLPEFYVVDFLGKAEPHIARTPAQMGPKGHDKWDYDYALATYDIAAAPFPMSEADLLEYAELPPHNWMYLWVFGRKMMAEGYVLLSAEELGLHAPDWGLFVRPDLAARFAPP